MPHTPYIRLDSSLPAPGWSFQGSAAGNILLCDSAGESTLRNHAGQLLRHWDEPLAALEWMASSASTQNQPGRWIGYLSYDLGRLFERVPVIAADPLQLPLFCFTWHEQGDSTTQPTKSDPPQQRTITPQSNFTRPAYESAVQRCIDYVRAGDIFQVNLSQRFSIPQPASPHDIYNRLQTHTPAWYGALLQYSDHALICNSPETFLRIDPQPDGKRLVTTRPIKGTRPRTPGMDTVLRNSTKDQAELNMIIDLERNDLGRVCEIGSVKVIEPRVIEAHPTVYHGAATIQGTLRRDVTFVDLLRATFPGGSITGAPKIRAMEIIEELEPTRRGPYCGAIGYLDSNGTMEFNIAIRTMIVKGGTIHISVGGGIVADSNPADEYEETLVKARAMFASLDVGIEQIEAK